MAGLATSSKPSKTKLIHWIRCHFLKLEPVHVGIELMNNGHQSEVVWAVCFGFH